MVRATEGLKEGFTKSSWFREVIDMACSQMVTIPWGFMPFLAWKRCAWLRVWTNPLNQQEVGPPLHHLRDPQSPRAVLDFLGTGSRFWNTLPHTLRLVAMLCRQFRTALDKPCPSTRQRRHKILSDVQSALGPSTWRVKIHGDGCAEASVSAQQPPSF